MNVAIVGFGIEGRSSYEHWTKLGHDVTIHDSKTDLELDSGIESVLGENYLEDLDDYDLVVRTPGIMPSRINTSAKITTATQEFFNLCPAPIIGVTGTKGKGTTCSIIKEILQIAGKKVWLGGNIGTAMLDLLPQVSGGDIVVLELSSFQLIDLRISPHIAVHLMMDIDHLDTHNNFDEYKDAKANIFRHQKPDDIAVYVATNTFSAQNVELSPAGTRYSVSIEPSVAADCYEKSGKIYFQQTEIMSVDDIPLLGRFNQENVCAAVAASWSYTQDPSVIRRGVMAFHGLVHRMQLIVEHSGVRYIDDSIAVNPSAALAAMTSFSEPLVVIVGGKDKNMDYQVFINGLLKRQPKKVVALGEIAERLVDGLRKENYQDVVGAKTMQEAVLIASQAAKPGDVVLLAPGTSSFDMYKDFAARGEEFDKAALELGESK